ncbi:hypothetical protein [Bordetella phage vB_BbrM_PHB04]|uniref:Uncharacterized protein n=1 Tax=Bordetella phage vB_BbrM_PHB04 TaxID=2029657 RepID=A0A291L9X6_9CAUD|nr:hypothetical protein HOS14_gp051 [Bordetella phage vB_BbrM_PHB04]ATI15669.1 hypothetical protein [Bordetella phage vB_BbrM_PHB04]
MKVIPRYRKRVYPLAGVTVYYLDRIVPMPHGMGPLLLSHSVAISNTEIEQAEKGRSLAAYRLLRARREIRSIDITRRKD